MVSDCTGIMWHTTFLLHADGIAMEFQNIGARIISKRILNTIYLFILPGEKAHLHKDLDLLNGAVLCTTVRQFR
jgi:hypothetical protein